MRGAYKDYRKRHPGEGDVALVVELSVWSLKDDRGKKLAAYATAAIPTYWIVNLNEGLIEVYTGPEQEGYRSRMDFKPGQRVAVVIDANPVGEIAVDEILP